jgi:hypothetical protein
MSGAREPIPAFTGQGRFAVLDFVFCFRLHDQSVERFDSGLGSATSDRVWECHLARDDAGQCPAEDCP